MSVVRHLQLCSAKALLSESEKSAIKRSTGHITMCLRRYFKRDIKKIIVFGSYSRGTLLPRRIDEKSDIDLMVQFTENSARPQTYLDRLRRFSAENYKSSEISQSNPTIVLQLNHIMFELVPAVSSFFGQLYIPAPASDFTDWMETNPVEFNKELQAKNIRTSSKMKPLIRVVKYWNANNGYVFSSYELEQQLISYWYWGNKNLRDYFYSAFENLDLSWGAAQWRQERLQSSKQLVRETKTLELANRSSEAEIKITKILPRYW